tara:strand:- start:131 stop:820 length:690 start_codon:yes stop_codon:yes gene_type:complete
MIQLKKIVLKIKKLFPTKLKTNIKKLRKFNGYHDLDKKMLEFLNYKNGFYVDCGANDGVNQSTTWYYEKHLNWKGILIEPITSVFDELKKNRHKDNHFKNCALTSQKYQDNNVEFYYNKNDTLTGALIKKENSEKISVKAKTFNQIMDEINFKDKIDFFSLDVEGSELDVLEGINFSKHHIEYLLIETHNFSKLKRFLDLKNYKFIKRLSDYKLLDKPEYGDYLFKRNK